MGLSMLGGWLGQVAWLYRILAPTGITPERARRCELWELAVALELDVDDDATARATTGEPAARAHPIFGFGPNPLG